MLPRCHDGEKIVQCGLPWQDVASRHNHATQVCALKTAPLRFSSLILRHVSHFTLRMGTLLYRFVTDVSRV
jgi:hypothetical protein